MTVRNRAKAFAHRTRAPNRGPGFAVDVPRSNRPPGLTRGRGPGHQGAHQAARATATGHQVDGPRIAHQAARTRARSSGSSHQVDGHQVQAWRPTAHGSRARFRPPGRTRRAARPTAQGPGPGHAVRRHVPGGRRPGDHGPGFRMPRDQGAGGRRKAQAARRCQGGRMRYGGGHYGQVTRHKKTGHTGPVFGVSGARPQGFSAGPARPG